MGAEMSVDRVMDEVRKDAVFYRRSGGGVTFSGGEPLVQAEFVTECLRLSKRWGYHTAVETCGQVAWDGLHAAAAHTDLFLYDVKVVDADRHREWMGPDNRRIVANLERLLATGAQVIVRTPIVPGCNDDEISLEALAGFAAAHPRVRRYELLPYHRLGLHKYAALDMPQPDSLEEPPDGRLEVMADRVAAVSGAECVVRHGLK
jgi:pyruvate formate lyase activating enzyme